jgi:hypothetical protein
MASFAVRTSAFVALATFAALAAAACASTVEAAPVGRALAPYDVRAADLFDDAIEPAAVGYTMDSTPSSKRPHLRERTLAADAVVRARVVTLTSNRDEGVGAWQMGLRTIETLAGNPPAAFTLQIKTTDPSAGIVRSNEGRIAGMTFVAFLHEFADDADASAGGSAQLHFHVAPDSKDEVDAVRQAALLGEVR